MPGPNDPNGDADKALGAPEPPQSLATAEPHRVGDKEGAGAEPASGGSGPLDGEK